MNIKQVFKSAIRFVDDKSPVILTALAIGGVGATAILTGKATLKVHQVLSEVDFDSLPTEDKREIVVGEIAPAVIPPILTGAATVACIVGAQAKNTARIAALAGAYTLKDQAFADYREKAQEILGKKKEQEVHEQIAQKHVDAAIIPGDDYIQDTGLGNVLCYDIVMGYYFKADMESIRKAVNEINAQILDEGQATLNDFRYKLNLPDVKLGNTMGWNVSDDRKMEVDFSAILKDGKTPVLTMEYGVRPLRSWY